MPRITSLRVGLIGLGAIASVAAAIGWDNQGRLHWPERSDLWPTIGLTHALQYEGDGSTTFNRVRIDPVAYAAYLETGRFPVGSMLELEIRRSRSDADPARGGHYAGALLSRSLHVKDERGGPGTWTFYSHSGSSRPATALPRSAACYSCHAEHAATDQVFTQFYPPLQEARAGR